MSANQTTPTSHSNAPTPTNKRKREAARPPTKLEAALKISKLLKTFDPEARKSILELAANG